MKLRTISEVESFLAAVEQAKEEVWLESQEGDRLNLKSKISQYIAIAELLKNEGNTLELFCKLPSDEQYFYRFFADHPEAL